jgi:hypothetical protein
VLIRIGTEVCMSWHYLQGPEAASWDPNSSGGTPAALSKLIPTVETSSLPVKEMVSYRLFLFGMTLEVSTDDLGGDLLTLLRVGSLVRTSVRREKVKESPETVRRCFSKCCESLRKYGLRLSSRKTVRTFVPKVSVLWSKDLPAWGLWGHTGCWELGTSARLIKGKECGSLPTPTATRYGSNQGGATGRVGKERPSLQTMARRGMWPTPTKSDGTGGPGAGKNRQGGDNLRTRVGGQLNPTWVEWLMGWPLEWTGLRPLETDRYPSWLRQHGEY